MRRYGFQRSRELHRLRRADLVIDVVPFGEVAGEEERVVWPAGTTAMSVLGFDEAYEGAVGVAVNGPPPVRVASLPGIGVLKLVAWSEAPYRRAQDPIDLCTIMLAYQEVAGGRLYDEHADLLENENFDVRVASARIYGRDVAALLRADALRSRVLDVLEQQTQDALNSRLAEAMGSECHPDYAVRLRCLRALRLGLLDRLS